MPPMHYRTATQTRRGARSGYQESDDFEGLPVRQWRRGWVSVNTEPPKDADHEDDIWLEDPPFGMPKDTHLLPKYTQDLLRAARSSYTPLKRAAPDDDEDDNYDTVKREKKEEEPAKEGFRVWGWKQLPRTAEKPLPSLLAKRHKNTITLASRAGLAHISGPTITRARVRRLDAAGNAYHQTITLTAGQEVDGEIISTEIVPAPEVKEEEKPVKRRPPPPKRKPKGPGRGRKKGTGKLPLPMPATRSQQQAGEGGDEADGTEGSPADLQTPGPGDEKVEGSVGTPEARPAGSSDIKPDQGFVNIKTEAGTSEGDDGARDVVAGEDATDVQGGQSISNVATPTIKIEDGEEGQEFRDIDMVDSYITISDEEEYDEEDDREGGDEGEDNTLDIDGNTTANFEAQFQGLDQDQDQDMTDSDGSEVIQPSSVEEADDEPRNTSQEEELTISQPRFSPSGVSNLLSTSHFSSFRVEGSPLKNVVNLSPTDGSPMDSPAGGASVSGASYFEIQPASEIMDMDSGGEMASETHMFGGMHDEATTSGNTPLFETVPDMVVASHDTPIFDDMPGVPDVPDVLNLPDVPDVPGMLDVPEELGVPEAPDVSVGQDIPDDVPQTYDVQDTPSAQDVPDAQDAPAVQDMPDIHDEPADAEASELPDASSVLGVADMSPTVPRALEVPNTVSVASKLAHAIATSVPAAEAVYANVAYDGIPRPKIVMEQPKVTPPGPDRGDLAAYVEKLRQLELQRASQPLPAELLKYTPPSASPRSVNKPLAMAPPRPHAHSGPPSPVVERQEGHNMNLLGSLEAELNRQERSLSFGGPAGVPASELGKIGQQRQQQEKQQRLQQQQQQQQQLQQQIPMPLGAGVSPQQQQQHIPMPMGMEMPLPPPPPPPPSSDSSAIFDTSGFLMDDPSTAFANFDGFDPALMGPVDGTEKFGGFGSMVDSSDSFNFNDPNSDSNATNAPGNHQGPS